jgi:hypothetical protein
MTAVAEDLRRQGGQKTSGACPSGARSDVGGFMPKIAKLADVAKRGNLEEWR